MNRIKYMIMLKLSILTNTHTSLVMMHSSIFLKFLTESCRWQVAIFVVLAMTLRRKPEVLVNVMPKIMGNNKYLGQEKLPIIVWVIAQVFFYLVPVMLVMLPKCYHFIILLHNFFSDILQASQGDLVTGMFCWAHSLFPTLCAKSSGNPLARDLVLQLLERYILL